MSKILITGGSGFLGRHLALALKEKNEVILGSRNNKNNFIAGRETDCNTGPLDVTSMESVRDVLREVRPDIIIHGAASKFVDRAEVYPLETIDVNILGSTNIARAAMDYGVNFVLGISTDKACNPKNIYGISKAAMERTFCLLNDKSDTQFACVRYGNVAWSTGSVLPLWKHMYNTTGIIGTTGPDMRRFFFTIDHAVKLVLTALEYQEMVAGKILSREMKSAQIKDILNVWVNHIGGSWEVIEGRPGEKNDELLVGENELEYTRSLVTNNITHYLLSPNVKSKFPLNHIVSSATVPRLNEEEILEILRADPDV